MAASKLEHALRLAAAGFYIFPLVSGKKSPPAIKGWQEWATRSDQAIRAHWSRHPDDNIGISTSRFGDNEALLVIDVDNKGSKNGDRELSLLELDSGDLPDTYTQVTPTGGRHLVFRCDVPMRQGTDLLGRGLDLRSKGGYIVGAGSTIGAAEYTGNNIGVAKAPDWLVERCGAVRAKPEHVDPPHGVNAEAAEARARHYLEHEAPLAVEGEGGDETTYKVAARLKDFGIVEDVAATLLLDHWNQRCSPPWLPEILGVKVHNAYKYGQQQPGIAAPEAQFPEIVEPAISANAEKLKQQHPFDQLNANHAYVVAGGGDHVLWETTDKDGREMLEHLNIHAFHRKHAAWTMNAGKRDEKVTELWMASNRRRSYDGLCFMPCQKAPSRFYNMWRGFAYEPLPPDQQPTKEQRDGVEKFLDHARSNVCGGSDSLYRWLVGYFAHLVQRPWEKPLVALVFRGGKGVGKNALVGSIGALLGGHYLLTSNRRYLVGNFNGHLENCLLFALDEAFWSGDKQAEGQLKDLITGSHHVIEHKGKEPFRVENRTRIAIIGNEEWLVPSTADERRFAVFDVGDGRKQDRAYFDAMRVALEGGGYRFLLRTLLDFDIAGIDLNDAPNTAGLLDQKHATLDPFQQWWLDCLTEGRILSGDLENAWPRTVECERFRGAFRRYVKERNIRSRIPEDKAIGKTLKKIAGGLVAPSKSRSGDGYVNVYKLPSIEDARGAWDKYIGHSVDWTD